VNEPEPIVDSYPLIDPVETDSPLSSEVYTRGIHYSDFNVFARGGKCLIFSCRDLYLNRTVAYKKLKPEFSKDPHEKKRFLREARVTASLQHPNTLPIYEISRDSSGDYYFTMKLVRGFNLSEVIKKIKAGEKDFVARYTLDTLIGILVQISNCMNYAHTHGVIHRDLKPENILTGPFGEVLVIDWGQARVGRVKEMKSHEGVYVPSFDDITLTLGGHFQGTPLYMSPEQIRNRNDVDHLSDIYGLGVLLYEMLTKQNVVSGESVEVVMDQITSHEIVPPGKRAPGESIPPELEEICMKCLELDPKDRYPSVSHLLQAIRQFRLKKIEA